MFPAVTEGAAPDLAATLAWIRSDLADLATVTDSARAMFKGQTLVGHRSSVAQGRMVWALPGRDFADGAALAASDSTFRMLSGPDSNRLAGLKARTTYLNQRADTIAAQILTSRARSQPKKEAPDA